MRIPVGGTRADLAVECSLIASAPTTTARQWSRLIESSSSTKQQDAAEYAESIVSKWKLYSLRGRIASSQRQLAEMIRANPKIDVLALIAAEATWTTRDPRFGLCAFRRTWSNSIVVDYIAVHPMLLQTDSEVSGIGTAMLYATANIAKKIGAERVWLETTDSSVGYYQYLFADAVDRDLLVISTEDFYNRIHEYFQK